MLSLISGINRPYRGQVLVSNRELHQIPDKEKFSGLLGVLPQNPQSLFVKKTVGLDLHEMLKRYKFSKKEENKRVKRVARVCDISHLMGQHPYDLSGGEQQRAALAKILLLDPKILLLDEPTKGMDAEFKQNFAGIIRRLLSKGVTVLMVSHDIEFCAKYADQCALFFDGGIVTQGTPQEFFTGNSFYTTAANRMARHMIPEVITAEDVIEACGGTVMPEPNDNFYNEDEGDLDDDENMDDKIEEKKRPSNIKRKVKAVISFIILVLTIWKGFPIISDFGWASLTGDVDQSSFGPSKDQWKYVALTLSFIISGITFFLSIFQQGEKPAGSVVQVDQEKRNLSKRTLATTALVLLIIPLTIYVGIFYLGDRKYYFISMLIIIETMLPFAMIFEGRKPQARELVVISVLCAIAVSGRAAFFMLPQFKPVAAIVIIAGVAFGGESGFLVGAMTMFLSNMMYGQGPLTPWQMFAMGIIGFLSGLLFRKGWLRRDRMSLAVFGGVTVFFIYGGIMNPASVLTAQANVTWPMIVTSWVVGAAFDLIHAGATVFFLLLIGEPMLEKLDRIKVKYGLVEN